MSIQIIKAGVADAFYDEGRYGNQHLGIHPTGAMDTTALKVVNALTQNPLDHAALEMHFPAATIAFNRAALIALSGADFSAQINNQSVPLNKPVLVSSGTTLYFKKPKKGVRVYLQVQGGFKLKKWLNSSSTNLVCNAGGFNGRRLQADDEIEFGYMNEYPSLLQNKAVRILPFEANVNGLYTAAKIRLLAGRHFALLTSESRQQLLQQTFTISGDSNRMGYKLQASPLALNQPANIISSAVSKGTVQLLPNGQLIVLMADHQTTGGYPIIGHVISADIATMAQRPSVGQIQFEITTQAYAEEAFLHHHAHLLQLKNACNLRVNEFLNTKG